MMTRAQAYFKGRDPIALDYIPKLLGIEEEPKKESSSFDRSLKKGLGFNPKVEQIYLHKTKT